MNIVRSYQVRFNPTKGGTNYFKCCYNKLNRSLIGSYRHCSNTAFAFTSSGSSTLIALIINDNWTEFQHSHTLDLLYGISSYFSVISSRSQAPLPPNFLLAYYHLCRTDRLHSRWFSHALWYLQLVSRYVKYQRQSVHMELLCIILPHVTHRIATSHPFTKIVMWCDWMMMSGKR